MYAARYGHAATVRVLLERNAAVDAQTDVSQAGRLWAGTGACHAYRTFQLFLVYDFFFFFFFFFFCIIIFLFKKKKKKKTKKRT